MGEPDTRPDTPRPRPSLAHRARLPRLSGKASAAWLVCCFALTAALIPLPLGLPLWVRFEVVLALWWLIWLVALTAILHAGRQVTDDHQMHEPRSWFSADSWRSSDSWSDGFFWGCLWGSDGILVVLGLILLVGVVWLLVELAVPLLLFLLYFTARGMLANAVNDRHNCRGRLRRSLAWGSLWATAYTAPLALAVWLVHYAHMRSHQGG